jgi:7-cyano-7-deazaguanine synthase
MSAASSKAVVLLSGGLDSYTAAALARDAGFEIYALTVNYGQRHGHEILAARKVAEALGARAHRELAVDLAALGGSALLGRWRGAQGWAAPRHDSGDLCTRAEYVMLALALAWAEVLGAYDIFIGVNALDYSAIPIAGPSSSRHSRERRRSARKRELKAAGSASRLR